MEGTGEAKGSDQGALGSDPLAGQIESGSVIWRGTDYRQAQGEVYAFVEVEKFEGRQAEIMAEGDDDRLGVVAKAVEKRVVGSGRFQGDTLLSQPGDYGLEEVLLLLSQGAVLSAVGVDGTAVETETKSVTDVQLIVEEPEEGEESLRGQHLPEALEGNVVGEEGDLETGAPEEHDRARPVTAFQIFGVALPRVPRLQPKFLGDRRRDHCRSWVGFGQLQGPTEGEKGAVSALRGGGEEFTLVLKGEAEDSFALGKEGGSPPFHRTVENPLGPDEVGESRWEAKKRLGGDLRSDSSGVAGGEKGQGGGHDPW